MSRLEKSKMADMASKRCRTASPGSEVPTRKHTRHPENRVFRSLVEPRSSLIIAHGEHKAGTGRRWARRRPRAAEEGGSQRGGNGRDP